MFTVLVQISTESPKLVIFSNFVSQILDSSPYIFSYILKAIDFLQILFILGWIKYL